MAKHTIEKIYSSQVRLNALSVANLFWFIAPVNGKMKKIYLRSGANLPSDAEFNVFRNSTPQFTAPNLPKIESGTKTIQANLNTDVIIGDVISIDMTINPLSALLVPLTLIIEFEDTDEQQQIPLNGDLSSSLDSNKIVKLQSRNFILPEPSFINSSELENTSVFEISQNTEFDSGIATISPGTTFGGFTTVEELSFRGMKFEFEFDSLVQGAGASNEIAVYAGVNTLYLQIQNEDIIVFTRVDGATNVETTHDWSEDYTKLRIVHNLGLKKLDFEAYNGNSWVLIKSISVLDDTVFDACTLAIEAYNYEEVGALGDFVVSDIKSNIIFSDPMTEDSVLFFDASEKTFKEISLTDLKTALDALP